MGRPMSLQERLAKYVVVNPETGCHEWTGFTTQGYGVINFERRTWRVHRLVYIKVKGEIPAGLQLDHLCRVRACCNPDHLEAVTQRENIMRGQTGSAVNARKTRCIAGHPFEGDNPIITNRGRRECRACKTRRSAEFNRKRTSSRIPRRTRLIAFAEFAASLDKSECLVSLAEISEMARAALAKSARPTLRTGREHRS